MGRMNTPKMEVVRFKEQDVIVASGNNPNKILASGFNNTHGSDASFTFMNKVYKYADQSDLSNALGSERQSFKNGDLDITLAGLFAADLTATPKDIDGTYTWDGTGFWHQ